MALKLFRSTGYSSILSAGETRVAVHPGWLILATSLWVGFACNPALWRGVGAAQSLLAGAFIAAAVAAVLSLLGWRKTVKPAALLILFVMALAASAAWQATPPAENASASMSWSSLFALSWPDLLHWRAGVLLAALALPPATWICKTRFRRLSGSHQLGVNLTGMLAAGAVLAPSGFLLFRGIA